MSHLALIDRQTHADCMSISRCPLLSDLVGAGLRSMSHATARKALLHQSLPPLPTYTRR